MSSLSSDSRSSSLIETYQSISALIGFQLFLYHLGNEQMASKKVTLSADGTTATVATPVISDIVMNIIEPDSVLTGFYGLTQKALLIGAGFMFSNKKHTDNMFDFKSKTVAALRRA